jgi:hypothetical protein
MIISGTSAAIMPLAKRLYALISELLLTTLQARVSGAGKADEFDRLAPGTLRPSYPWIVRYLCNRLEDFWRIVRRNRRGD